MLILGRPLRVPSRFTGYADCSLAYFVCGVGGDFGGIVCAGRNAAGCCRFRGNIKKLIFSLSQLSSTPDDLFLLIFPLLYP